MRALENQKPLKSIKKPVCKISRTLSVPIQRPCGYVWNDFGHLLCIIRNDVAQAYNMAMSESYLYFSERENYKREHGKYPKVEQLAKRNVYKKLTENFPHIGTGILATIANKVESKLKKEYVEVMLKGTKSVSNYKKGTPIPIRAQGWKERTFKRKRKDKMTFHLLSKKAEQSKSLDFLKDEKGKIPCSFTVRIALKKLNNSQRAVYNRIWAGEYKAGAIDILQRKGKWFINISYHMLETKRLEKQLDKNVIVGVDLGIVNGVVCAVSNDAYDRLVLRKDIEGFRKQIWKRKHLAWKSTRRGGKGRKYYLRMSDSLKKKDFSFNLICSEYRFQAV